MKHNIKIIPVDGQPYGRPLRPYSKYITINELKEFDEYADRHQHPFPGATIGDVIEADKVEVVWQLFENRRWYNIGYAERLIEKMPDREYRQIYRLKEQPVSKEPEETAEQAAENFLAYPSELNHERIKEAFRAGVNWYKKQQEGK